MNRRTLLKTAGTLAAIPFALFATKQETPTSESGEKGFDDMEVGRVSEDIFGILSGDPYHERNQYTYGELGKTVKSIEYHFRGACGVLKSVRTPYEKLFWSLYDKNDKFIGRLAWDIQNVETLAEFAESFQPDLAHNIYSVWDAGKMHLNGKSLGRSYE